MASIDVNNTVITNLNGDNIAAALNRIIDNELQKDIGKMDTKLVDDCVNALLEIEKDRDNSFTVLIPLMSSDAFLRKISPVRIRWKDMNIFARAGIVAALLASTTVTANAAYQNLTGVNVLSEIGSSIQSKLTEWGVFADVEDDVKPAEEKTTAIKEEEPTTQKEEPVSELTTGSVSMKLTRIEAKPQIEQLDGDDEEDEEPTTKGYIEQMEGDDEEETTTQVPTTRRKPEPVTEKPVVKPTQPADPEQPVAVLESLSADFDDNFKLDYIYGEALSYDGLTLTAHYSDESSRTVLLDECSYTKSVNMNTTADYTLRIIYETCVIKIDITVRPDEETRGATVCENELYEYMLTKRGAYITKYKGNEKDITLDVIDGSTVYAIGADVYRGKNIEHFSADNCAKIFDRAFMDCEVLEDCYTPRAVSIGACAFENDKSLKVPVFSNDLSYLGTAAYKNSGITELLPASDLGEIPDDLCENCTDLTIVNLRGAEAVGSNAFSGCTSLETVNGTDGLTTVGDFAFYNCTNAVFTEKPRKLTSAGNNAFAYCNSIEFGKLYLTELAPYSFLYCHNLKEVEIDGSVRIIPEGCFRGTHLEELKLNEGTREIDDTAFMSTSVSKVELPFSVRRIGTYGLYSTKLREVYTTRNLATIEESAFFRSRLTLFVYENSYAHTYALDNNVKFEFIGNYDGVIQIDGEDD